LEHVPSLENFAIPDYRQDHDNYRLQVCRQIRAEQARITPVNFVPGYTVATNVEKNMDSLQAAMPVDLTSANTIAGKARQNPAEIQTTGASMASGARQLSHRPGGAQDTSLPTPLVRPRYQNLHQNIAQFTGSATDEILQAVRGRPALRLPGNTMKTSQVPTARPGIAGGHGTELTQINPPVTSVGSCDSKHAKTTQPGHAAPIANVNNDSLQDSDFHPSEIHRPFSSAADPLHQMHPQANHQGAFTGQGEITNSSSAPKATQYQAPEPPVPASVRLRQHLDSHHASRMKSAEPSEPEIIPCTTTKRKRQPSRRLIDNVLANSDATPVPRSDQDGDYDPSRSTRAAPKRNRLTPKRIARGSLENKKRTSARGQSDGAGDSPSFDSEKIKTSDGRVVGRARDQVSTNQKLGKFKGDSAADFVSVQRQRIAPTV
jgi:hypothetical protein